MRTLTALALAVLCAACASKPAVRPEGALQRVVVVASSRVPKPVPGSIHRQLLGEDEPRELVAQDAQQVLRTRGFEVLEAATSRELEPTAAQVRELITRTGAEAALVLVLRRLDLSSLRTLGRAEVELEARLVAPDGKVLWSNARQVSTAQWLYRARTDWRSHLWQAVNETIREVP